MRGDRSDGRHGRLVPPDDVDALARAIEDVVTAPDRIDRLYTELLARDR